MTHQIWKFDDNMFAAGIAANNGKRNVRFFKSREAAFDWMMDILSSEKMRTVVTYVG